MSSVRTPDPNPGWLSEEDLNRARATLPIVYVQAIPVRLDPLGCLSEIGLLLTAKTVTLLLLGTAEGMRAVLAQAGGAP